MTGTILAYYRSMLASSRIFASLTFAAVTAACSSSSPESTSPALSEDSHDAASPVTSTPAPLDGGSTLDAQKDGKPSHLGADSTSPGVKDAATTVDSAPASTAEVDASSDCVAFCDCMATNCSTNVFSDGCLRACAAQTTWDLACRQVMCTLAPQEPNNDHCTHAMGINECLDLDQ